MFNIRHTITHRLDIRKYKVITPLLDSGLLDMETNDIVHETNVKYSLYEGTEFVIINALPSQRMYRDEVCTQMCLERV
jgi:hypothetical protein